MFETLSDVKPEPQDRKLLLLKIGMFVLAVAVLGGVIYLFTFASYTVH